MMSELSGQTFEPAFALQQRLGQETSLSVSSCFQCKKCSAGCPLTFAMDFLPDQVIRLALLGQEDLVLGCRTIWVCSSCVTCTTRCPNDIDIAGLMDWLKEAAIKRGKAVAQPEVAAFHRFFLGSIRAGGGRLSEVRLLRKFSLFKMRRKPDVAELMDNLKLGWKLFKRGRMRLKGPPGLKGKGEIKQIFQRSGF
jgi:heterodisulfide reductase subunit C